MITLKPPPAANHTPHEIVQNAAGDCISIHLFLEDIGGNAVLTV